MTTTSYDRIIAALIASPAAMTDRNGDIALSSGVQPDWAVVKGSGLALTQDQLDKASAALRGVIEQARAWHWDAVETKLDAAYRALGAENPGTGNDFHRGAHPAQAHL